MDAVGSGTIAELARRLRAGETSSVRLLDAAFERITDPNGQGHLVFIETLEHGARQSAAAADVLLAAGFAASPLAGLPISVKDLFDTAGSVTRAGSKVLRDHPPARTDAAIVARLRAAGAVIVGRTNMTEFAYSGLGLNPHYGTPLNPYDRAAGRIPGGSSSGAAISIVDGMCTAGIGSDTGGSVRIPAALTGLVGFKPTQHRVPMAGTHPLSPTLDTIGPLARSVACCAALDAILAGEPDPAFEVRDPRGLRLGIVRDYVFEQVSDYVGACFDRALEHLASGGVHVRDVSGTQFLCELPAIGGKGGFAAAESFHILHGLIESAPDLIDPRVAQRVLAGGRQSADDYLQLLDHRRRLIEASDAVTAPLDAVAFPTVPVIAPRLSELEDDAAYFAANTLMLRNPSVANFLDRPAITLPVHREGEAPTGLMLVGERGADRRLLSIAAGFEARLASIRTG